MDGIFHQKPSVVLQSIGGPSIHIYAYINSKGELCDIFSLLNFFKINFTYGVWPEVTLILFAHVWNRAHATNVGYCKGVMGKCMAVVRPTLPQQIETDTY